MKTLRSPAGTSQPIQFPVKTGRHVIGVTAAMKKKRIIYPNIGISSEDLARAMVDVGLDSDLTGDKTILENRDIREVASR